MHLGSHSSCCFNVKRISHPSGSRPGDVLPAPSGPAAPEKPQYPRMAKPIAEQLAVYLDGYMASLRKDCGWLFPSKKSKTGHTVNINKPFRRVAKAAGLDPTEVVRHTLRHTAITHLVQAGVPLPTVKRISGHKTLAMVERYAHTNGKHICAAMDLLESSLNSTQQAS